MKVANGVTAGLLIKKVNPVYPTDARSAYIQGTVVLEAEISKTGDITDLELVERPNRVGWFCGGRGAKYKPYLLMGQPVTVDTQVQVNDQLSR